MKKSFRLITHSVVVQLIIGAILKAYLPHASIIEQSLQWTTFSVIGLFMSVGLQLHPEKFKKDFNISVILVGITTIIPMALFYWISRVFDLTTLSAWTIAVVLVTTGTGVTIQTLSNLGMLRSKVGEFIVLISALDDIPAAIVMAVLLTIAPVVKDPSIAYNWTNVILAALAFIILLKAKNKILRSLLILAFGVFAAKAMESFHVSTVMGGLIAGVFLSLTIGSPDEEVSEFMDKLLKPVLIFYMIFIGMKLSPSIFKTQWALWLSIILIVVAVVSKWLTTWLLLRKREDLFPEIVAWGMVPRGIPGFAFASASVSSGLIDNDLFTILILIVSVTTWVGLIGIEYSARKRNLVKI